MNGRFCAWVVLVAIAGCGQPPAPDPKKQAFDEWHTKVEAYKALDRKADRLDAEAKAKIEEWEKGAAPLKQMQDAVSASDAASGKAVAFAYETLAWCEKSFDLPDRQECAAKARRWADYHGAMKSSLKTRVDDAREAAEKAKSERDP